MTRFVFVADVHVGNHRVFGGPTVAGVNARARACAKVLKDASDVARSLDARLVILGDLFDDARPSPAMEVLVAEAIGATPTMIIKGNHDSVSDIPGDHALGPLEFTENISVYEHPFQLAFPDVEVIFVPFRAGNGNDWLPPVVDGFQKATRPRVLCVHLGIKDSDSRQVPWLRDATDAVDVELLAEVCKRNGIQQVFAGNWHGRKEIHLNGVNIVQVGTLCPTGFDNPGFDYHGMAAEWSPREAVTWHDLPGPRFVNVSSEAQLTVAVGQAKVRGCQLYVRWKVSGVAPEQAAGVLAHSREVVRRAKEAGQLVAGEVVLDASVANGMARRAASAARSAETLAEALEAFVSNMPVADGVDRKRVLQLSQTFLR